MARLINKLLHLGGYQICSYPGKDLSRRLKLINQCRIGKLLDVGANYGGYSKGMRKLGFKGKIISFEPLSSAFKLLAINASKDNKWEIFNYAIGNHDGYDTINIAGNSCSSSLNKMLDTHVKAKPASKYVGTEKIRIKKIDTIFHDICRPDEKILLKIDTQGYEEHVIEGAKDSLGAIHIIQLEMSLIPLYENELLLTDMINFMKDKDFELVSIEPGFSNSATGQLYQVDGIFINKKLNFFL